MGRINHEKLNRQSKVDDYDKRRNHQRYKKGSSIGIKLEFKKMNAKYKGICSTCFEEIKVDSVIKYFPKEKAAVHYHCKNI